MKRKLKTAFLIGLLSTGAACGYSSQATTPPSPGTTPTITELLPDNVNSGSGDFVLTVNGTHYNSNAAINWNGVAQATTFVTPSQLTATIPATAVANSGSAMVTVTNPGTQGGRYGGGTLPETSNAMTFTVN